MKTVSTTDNQLKERKVSKLVPGCALETYIVPNFALDKINFLNFLQQMQIYSLRDPFSSLLAKLAGCLFFPPPPPPFPPLPQYPQWGNDTLMSLMISWSHGVLQRPTFFSNLIKASDKCLLRDLLLAARESLVTIFSKPQHFERWWQRYRSQFGRIISDNGWPDYLPISM